MSDESLDNCGCCEGTSSETPVVANNRPGQSRIDYRVGTHARFKESMLAALTGTRPLEGLKTRDDQDASIALLDGAATVLDVLSFYNERIANEGFLRTSTERRSVLELARAIGYELNPGVAASTYLAFTLEDAVGAPTDVRIPIGTKAQSIPGQDEKPQTFETVAAAEARPIWNRLRPRLTQPHAFSKGDTFIYLAGTDANLKLGDVLVFVGDERANDPASDQYDVRRVTALDVQPRQGRTLVSWSPPLAHGPLTNGELFVLRTRAALFGHNAQPWSALPVALRIGERDPSDSSYPYDFIDGIYRGRRSSWADAKFGSGKNTLDLDAVYDGIAAGAGNWLVLAKADNRRKKGENQLFRLFNLNSVAETSVADFNLSAKVTRLGIAGSDIEAFSPRNASPFLKSEKLKIAESPITTLLPANDWVLATQVADLKKGQWVAITEQHYDHAGKPVGPAISDVVQIEQASVEGGLTKLRFDRDLIHAFERDWTTLNANVAPATHGETRKEVLGSGDASKPLQQFVLKQKPITYVPSSAASGATSTLAIRVNDVLWEEKPWLYGEPPDESLFVTRLDDDGSVRVTFGDGERGRRLPTGVENVEATYRVGTGQDGMVKAEQISLLATRPLGVREVINPLAPEGAEDPEKIEDARDNAPLTVLTLDRVVSLLDFENFARAFGGIAKARAAWLWDKESRIVHLTLAAPKGEPVDPSSDLAGRLRNAIDARRHSKIGMQFGSYTELKFAVDAALRIDPSYDPDKVRAAVKQALVDTFSFEEQAFAVSLPASRVIAVMQAINGIVAIDLNYLYFVGAPVLPNTVLAARPARWVGTAIAPAEMVVIDPDAITLGDMPS